MTEPKDISKSKKGKEIEYQHFSMVRNFYVADFLTLMNGCCGVSAVLCCLNYLLYKELNYLYLGYFLVFLGCFFDIFDGRVARLRNESSLLGQELDSLADLISFGLAPACLGFSLGLRTFLDQVVLVYFVCCGIARLARYNATVANLPKDKTGKINYFEGTPIPTSLALVLYLAYLTYYDDLKFETFSILGVVELSYVTLLYGILGSTMISRSLRIPKL